jgi:cell division protein FtsL
MEEESIDSQYSQRYLMTEEEQEEEKKKNMKQEFG